MDNVPFHFFSLKFKVQGLKLVIGYWLLVIGYWIFIFHSLLFIPYFLFLNLTPHYGSFSNNISEILWHFYPRLKPGVMHS